MLLWYMYKMMPIWGSGQIQYLLYHVSCLQLADAEALFLLSCTDLCNVQFASGY